MLACYALFTPTDVAPAVPPEEPPSIIMSDGTLYGVSMTYPKYEELIELRDRIIQCESEWNYKAQSPISTAYGLGQFLDGTWEYVQTKWDMQLDRTSYEDQLYATTRLLKEEGEVHWLESKFCWYEA